MTTENRCAVCKGRPATHEVRPFGNPDYASLPQCDECNSTGALFAPY